ncbi:9916_t:CDS:2 [Paraglomus brasilianum]|uniref:9916_t:CDS:1 n=1 Tax=Paraglomus brasilianum TaxID=144538 RepID=A0A9N8VW31_9GLOM|nr:9916_t:CDS:2 [Paraglomus brasilianum]
MQNKNKIRSSERCSQRLYREKGHRIDQALALWIDQVVDGNSGYTVIKKAETLAWRRILRDRTVGSIDLKSVMACTIIFAFELNRDMQKACVTPQRSLKLHVGRRQALYQSSDSIDNFLDIPSDDDNNDEDTIQHLIELNVLIPGIALSANDYVNIN